ncbi:proteoglycan 4a [Brienomyrus brachyistius]|uniref:proteoglycan 4a n=1 Tax=Brienomyrus brachyistius TaxID=42636 RepID=UPI0020B393A5|nr:proteoglycan 4a [Brienomyrus brachyistius]
MTSPSVLAGLLAAFACLLLPFCAAQATCRGRCGEPFSRGQVCHCDYRCLFHNECCEDFESTCTTSGSCVGRCGEPFKRGQQCDCDPNCVLYNQCCPDFQTQCNAESPKNTPMKKPDLKLEAPLTPTSESEEMTAEQFDNEFPNSLAAPVQQPEETVVETPVPPIKVLVAPLGPKNTDGYEPIRVVVQEVLPSHDGAIHGMDPAVPELGPAASATLPAGLQPIAVIVGETEHQVAPSSPANPFGPDSTSGKPVATVSLEVRVSASKTAEGPERPSTLADVAEALASSNPDGSLTNLCNGQLINGVTVLLNGTMVVFRGHFFWTLDVNFTPSPARRITEVWGVPSPIDAVFTRSNCQGQTYIIKGNNYWRFENGVMDPGYPKTLSVEFNGLSGKITAALSVPATRRRPESIYFFKKEGLVQRYSYEAGAVPTCGKKFPVYSGEKSPAGEAEIGLGNEINIKLTWKGFPSTVTSAVSTPNPRKSEGYDYYIFSNDKYHNVKVVGDRLAPVSALPRGAKNTERHWLRCL